MRSDRERLLDILVIAVIVAAGVFLADGARAASREGIVYKWIDSDRNGADSPGDSVLFGNRDITLKFEFVNLSGRSKQVKPTFNGYFLDTVKYRGEVCFKHPDWRT
jgi:hypothetical protein